MAPHDDGMERLTASDLSMLWPDDLGWPQDIGAIAYLDGRRLLDHDGRFRIEDARSAIEAKLARVRRLRQVLLVPRLGLGWPLWVDAPVVDLGYHVRVLEVPAPADEAQVLRAVERLRRRRLDRSRPLWEMWFLTGLPEGRVALYIRAHHALADGVAGIAVLGSLLDTRPTTPASSAPQWTPQPVPTMRDLMLDNARRRIGELRRTMSAIARLPTTLRTIRESWPAVRDAVAQGKAPRTSVNRPIGPGRTFAFVRSDLGLTKHIAHTHGATVNDVLMAAMAGGLRALLQARGERTHHVVLRAYVPVSLHREQPGQARGNLDGIMSVGLPLGIADPVDRLRRITAETAVHRRQRHPAGGSLLRFSLLQRALTFLMPRQRMANVYAANVPGPAARLFFLGAPVLELFPLVPLLGNITLGVGALSYAGQFNITAIADDRSCPDLDVFVEGMKATIHSLAESLTASANGTFAATSSARVPSAR